MKTSVVTTILLVACVGLVIALVFSEQRLERQKKGDADKILDFSNQWVSASDEITDLRQVNLALTNDLDASRQSLDTANRQFSETSASLSNALQTAHDQVATLNGRVSDLEAQNEELDQRAAAMTNALAALNQQISETQAKLSKSETNNTFLQNELQRQLAAKEQLEHKFNDLTAMRAQVKKLRADEYTQRRLEWAKQGVDPSTPPKGGQLLTTRAIPAAATKTKSNPFFLDVVIGSDGTIHVLSPTNSPAK